MIHGLSCLERGKLSEAEKAFSQVLAEEPDNVDALHLLGVLAMQTGRFAYAVDLIGKVVVISPGFASAHNNLGNGLRELNRLDEALASFDKAVALQPGYAQAHSNRGNVLMDMNRPKEALASFDRAVELDQGYAKAHNNRGLALRDLKRHPEALAAFERALALEPGFADAHSNRGLALQDLKRPQEALKSFDTAISLRPEQPEFHNNRGNALLGMKRWQEALESLDRAIALHPGYAEAYGNRGLALRDLKRPEEALVSYNKALELRPDFAEAYNNRGLALVDLRRFGEALADHDKAIALQPDFVEAYWSRSIALLLAGRLQEGLRQYEWRKKREEPVAARSFSQPLWLGEEDISGKTLFVHWEQGYGDTIQFCRYAKLASARGAKVILSVQDALRDVLNGLDPGVEVIGAEEIPESFDYHCPLMSLPLAFGTTIETIPAEAQYIRPDPSPDTRWLHRLENNGKPNVGLAWSGKPSQSNDRFRSIPLEKCLPMLVPEVNWISLQKDVGKDDGLILRDSRNIRHFGSELADFGDTASLIQEMNLVVSVCTSVAHLAGAMGKPVWILLSFNADWRWFQDRSDSPWYPSARLFRQPDIDNWEQVVDQVIVALRSGLAIRR